IAAGTPSSGGPGTLTCTGGNARTVVAGVATFAGCALDKVGTNYQLTATSTPALTPATSAAFSVVAGPASKLTFIVQPPATAAAGAPFPANIQVGITDAGGNVVTSGIVGTISLAIGTNPSAGTLACTGGNTASTVNGIATFPGCSINNQGIGYTLVATAISTAPVTALTPATSSAFNVAAQAAVITLTTVPANGVIVWGNSVVLNIHFVSNGANKTFRLEVSKD